MHAGCTMQVEKQDELDTGLIREGSILASSEISSCEGSTPGRRCLLETWRRGWDGPVQGVEIESIKR